MQMVSGPLPTPSSRTAATHDDCMTSASRFAYDSGPYGTYWDSHTAFGSPWILWPDSSDRCLLTYSVEQDIRDPNHFLGEPSTHRSLSYATYSHYPSASDDQNVTNPFITSHLPSHGAFSPSLPHWCPRPTSIGHSEPDPQFRPVPPQGSTASSRRRQGARAVEYGGLWIDEEELLEGLTESGGKLNVHQCLWEEDRSPCHLWIKSDRSCINAHIQKWHKGRPGENKLEVDCRWSACGKTMLKESISRHILSIHLGEMWKCQGCGKGIARKDAYGQHAVRSDVEGCQTAGALIIYSVDVRVIDARVALESGGSLRYADA